EDRVGGSGPRERTTMQIIVSNIVVDLLNQLFDAVEGAAPDFLLGDEPEPALDLVEPAGVSGRVMNVVARMTGHPGLDLGMLVSAVVIGDEVDVQTRRNIAVEMVEKRQEFLMAMARLALSDHFAIEHVERGEQRRGAVAIIIVRYSFNVTQAHWQHRLAALQRLHLTFFVYAQHQRIVGRIEVQAYDVAHFLHEERIGGKLEALGPMRLQTKQRKIATDCTFGNTADLRRRAHTPLGGVCGFVLQNQTNQLRHCFVVMSARTSWPKFIVQSGQTPLLITT